MKALYVLLLCIAALSGCEQLTDTGDLPYSNQLVVHYFLEAGTTPWGEITHTVPLSVPYSDSAASAPGAVATITVDGKSYPLTKNGIGYGTFGLTILEGKTYTLDVTWQGLHAHSITTVPFATPIDSILTDTLQVDYDSTEVLLSIGLFFRPLSSSSYLVSAGSEPIRLEPFQIRGTPSHFSSADGIRKQAMYADLFSRRSYADTAHFHAELLTFTLDYYNFTQSYYHSHGNGAFNASSLNPNWNIEGDGIGYFTGYAQASREVKIK